MALEVPDLPSGNPQLQRALNKIARVEEENLAKVDQKIAKVDNKLKLVKDLKQKFTEVRDAVNPFRKVADFRELIGVSSNPQIVSTSAINKDLAQPGTYKFEVLELASSASLMTTGVEDKDKTELGVGYISFETPDGETHDLYVNSGNNTLEGIARTINTSGLGLRASVVNDGTDSDEPWRLIISGEKTGWKNDYSWAQFNFLDGDIDIDHEDSAQAKSAKIRFNGQPMYVDENSIKDLIPGVTIDLNKAVAGETVTINVKPDFAKISERAGTMVEKINAVLSFIQYQSQLGPDSRNDPTKALSGDTSVQALQSRITTLIQDTASQLNSSQVTAMRDVGIVFNRSGTLDFDQKKFQSALETRFDDVALLLSGTSPLNGFANEMGRLVDQVTRTGDGFVTLKENSMTEQKQRIEREKEQKTERAQAKIARATTQFARAEEAMAKLQQVSGQFQGMGAALGR